MREHVERFWLKLARRNRRVLFLDLLLLAFAVYIGYALRLTLLISPLYRTDLLQAAVLFPLITTVTLYLGGVYRIYWPQASVPEYARLTRSYAFGGACFVLVSFFLRSLTVPRSSLAITLFAGIILTGGMRASWRLVELAGATRTRGGQGRKTTLIIGAGEAGAYIARDLQRHAADLQPIGFIDEDPQKREKIIAGLPVLGSDADIERIAGETGAEVVLIAIPSAEGTKVRAYLETLSKLGIEVRVLPSLYDLAGGRVKLRNIRSVELQDLLRREPINLDKTGVGDAVNDRRILVTGAGGSIGSEICRQLLRLSPAELILLGHGEQSLYELCLKLGTPKIPCSKVVADIADERMMARVFERYKPQVVFHAAAHKHVPLMEENPREALRVNAFGTWILSDLAGLNGAERFVMISTDKAVNPTSVMGATKRIAERLLRNAQDTHPNVKYVTVRFGNVLGSRGSVVPLFEQQIRNGGPVTVTHRDMNRYFMLIPEAVSLVLQSGAMGEGGELYVLDMGDPVNITEMAETLIRLHGMEPYRDVQIVFTGIRRGEKLYEELFYDPACVDRTRHDKIFLSLLDWENQSMLTHICEMLSLENDEELRRKIFELAAR